MKLICRYFKDLFEIESLFFCLIKRTKNQDFGMVVKAQISILWEISLRGALFCSLLNSLILSVIFCEATDKPLAFQFANKTQQSQGRKLIWNWELGFMNDRNCTSLNRVYRFDYNILLDLWLRLQKVM